MNDFNVLDFGGDNQQEPNSGFFSPNVDFNKFEPHDDYNFNEQLYPQNSNPEFGSLGETQSPVPYQTVPDSSDPFATHHLPISNNIVPDQFSSFQTSNPNVSENFGSNYTPDIGFINTGLYQQARPFPNMIQNPQISNQFPSNQFSSNQFLSNQKSTNSMNPFQFFDGMNSLHQKTNPVTPNLNLLNNNNNIPTNLQSNPNIFNQDRFPNLNHQGSRGNYEVEELTKQLKITHLENSENKSNKRKTSELSQDKVDRPKPLDGEYESHEYFHKNAIFETNEEHKDFDLDPQTGNFNEFNEPENFPNDFQTNYQPNITSGPTTSKKTKIVNYQQQQPAENHDLSYSKTFTGTGNTASKNDQNQMNKNFKQNISNIFARAVKDQLYQELARRLIVKQDPNATEGDVEIKLREINEYIDHFIEGKEPVANKKGEIEQQYKIRNTETLKKCFHEEDLKSSIKVIIRQLFKVFSEEENYKFACTEYYLNTETTRDPKKRQSGYEALVNNRELWTYPFIYGEKLKKSDQKKK